MFRSLVLMVLLMLLFTAPGALAISIAEMTLEELIEEADYVVIAFQKSSRIVEKEPFVIKEYTLEVEKTLKGDSASGTVLTVRQDTGYGGPSYKNDQLFLAFIATDKNSKDYYIINGIQGLWPLDENHTPTWWGSEYSMEEIERASAKSAGPLLNRAWPVAAAALVLAAVIIIAWSRKRVNPNLKKRLPSPPD